MALLTNPMHLPCDVCKNDFISFRSNHTSCSKRCQNRKWYLANFTHKKSETTLYHKTRPLVDENFRLARNLRKRLRTAMKDNFKTGSAVSDLGLSIDDFKKYLESKFVDGMNWENYGRKGWHIDHIIPLSKFDLSDPNQQKAACHHSNLQPMWWKDNLRKGNHGTT